MKKLLDYKLSPEAIKDISDLRDFLLENGEIENFPLLRSRIKSTIMLIRKFPELGTYQEEVKARRIVVPKTKYLIFFRKTANLLEILRIYHSYRKWR